MKLLPMKPSPPVTTSLSNSGSLSISRGQVGSFPRGSIVCPWEYGFHCRVLLCMFRLCCLLSCMERLSCNDPLLSSLQSLHAGSSHYSQYWYMVPHTLQVLRRCLPRLSMGRGPSPPV